MIDVDIDYPVKEMGGRRPIGWSHLNSNRYSLVQIDGKWTFPASAADSVKVGYQSDIGIYAKGLTEVERFQWTADDHSTFYQEFSPNGIDDVTCSQYPGGVAYDGPDMLQMPIGFAYPGYYLREYPGYVPPEGYYKLYFGPEKAFWAVYDLTTGRMTDSHLPPPEPLRLVIAPVVKVSGASLGSTQQVQRAVRLSVSGPTGTTAVLECTDIVGGQWATLHELVLVSGTNTFVDDASPTIASRFYRVRTGN
jgi:hypothetical protein